MEFNDSKIKNLKCNTEAVNNLLCKKNEGTNAQWFHV